MKRGLLIGLGILLTVALLFGGCATPPPEEEVTPPAEEEVTPPPEEEEYEPIKLTVTSVFPPPGLSLEANQMEWWQNEVTERTNGLITFETHWAAALGAPPEHIELVKSGMVDLAQTYCWYTPSKLPLHNFPFVFPFGPTDPQIIAKAKWQILKEFPVFEENMNKQNVTLIMLGPSCPYEILSKIPLDTVDDLDGVKMQIIGGYFTDWVKASGATPVASPAHDWYTNFETGLADTLLAPWNLCESFKLYEQAKYSIGCRTISVPYYSTLVNLDTYNSLPTEWQKILKETGEAATTRWAEVAAYEYCGQIIDRWVAEEGVTRTEWPQTEIDKWANRCPDTAAKFATDMEKLGFPQAWDIVERWQEITAEMGYKWPRHWGER